MRIAFLSDIHGNLEALSSVLNDVNTQSIEKLHCLGDVIGYGCDPGSCLDLISKCCEGQLMGNHEYAALGLLSTEYYNPDAKHATQWTIDRLTDYDLSLISDFKMELVVDNYRLVHSSPFQPDQWHYIVKPEHAAGAFESFEEKFCFIGHSHQPMIFTEIKDGEPRMRVGHDFLPDPDSRYIINVGSIGQPRDNDPRASYVIFDTNEYEITYRRVEYDIDLTQKKMQEQKLPKMLYERLSVGK